MQNFGVRFYRRNLATNLLVKLWQGSTLFQSDFSALGVGIALVARRAVGAARNRIAARDAAWIAQEQGNPRQVWEYGHRAEMLADSPLLGSADRGAIRQRISRAPDAVQLAMRQKPPTYERR